MKVHPAAALVFGDQLETSSRYIDILINRGIDWGLLGPREAERVWERHILNCAALASLPKIGARVADVGSGAGLPGIPLAIARPDLSVVLMEPLLRRSSFLSEAIEELGLGDRVSVVRARAEDVEDDFDVVTARAVAPLGKLIGWTRPLFGSSGELLAMKGSSAQAEVADAAKVLRKGSLSAEVLEVRAAEGLDATYVVRVRGMGVSRETHGGH